MAETESKELLKHNGFPIISYALDLCDILGIEPVVISRQEKTSLNNYLMSYNIKHIWHYPKERQSMAETILASSDHWMYNNILILPDTRFKPALATLEKMKSWLNFDNIPLILATHQVSDPNNWGIIESHGNDKYLCEKPEFHLGGDVIKPTDTATAWGLIGFNKYAGFKLFEDMKQKNTWSKLPESYEIPLTSFEDLTRTKERTDP